MSPPTTFSLALSNETATAHSDGRSRAADRPRRCHHALGATSAPAKTAAARALIRYLAGDDALEVPSPTFTLVQAYELPPFPLLHADLYRVNDTIELEEIGLSPLPEGTVALIEWPERAPSALPADRIDIALSHRPALGSDRARRRGHRPRQGRSPSRKAASAAAVPRRRGLCRGEAPAHGRRRVDAFLCAADPRQRRCHPDELAPTPRRTGDL